jgi:hypothetical protein
LREAAWPVTAVSIEKRRGRRIVPLAYMAYCQPSREPNSRSYWRANDRGWISDLVAISEIAPGEELLLFEERPDVV